MLLRRAGGRVRWLPGDLLAAPAMAVGAWLLAGVRVLTNRVADGPTTVRVLVASPREWLSGPLGWVGLGLLAAGLALGFLARRLADPGRWGTAVRFLPYRAASFLLLAAAALSLWELSSHVSDLGSGGAQWRFLAEPRVRWVNDVTTILLAAASAATLALSFGRVRAVDFEARPRRVGKPPAAAPPAQASRDRVPTTTAASASSRSTMPTGVATKSRSGGASRRPDSGS